MPSRAERVKQLFDAAIDLPEAERGAFLADACSGDEQLRGEVQGLLQALAQASGFLVEGDARSEEAPGTQIDRYTLQERIGEGGFGVVFRAEQHQPLRRDVALKVIKLGMDTSRVIARFEQERQALARMQHPHIAAVFDGGTTPSGRPYFVMELVQGLPITRYCRERGLGIDERVALFRQVCVAVQHAHHKGVVHRDLKPANVMVADDEHGRPAPKVIDFGIAKAMNPDGDADDNAEPTLTQLGQPLGTLEYMAPEQTAGDRDIDARADVYSLGVVLYELLVGKRPFERGDGHSGTFTGLLERIRTEHAARPSARVDARCCPLAGADARRWARQLRDELDWIVLRAIAKDPARRYPTPNALAEDLGRFLDARPVEAGPPTPLYHLRCFVARHRLAVAASLVFVGLLVAGVISTAAALAESRAQSARQQRTLQAMQQLLLTADPTLQKGPDYKVRQLLDDFASGMDAWFGTDPIVARDLHLTIGGAYRNLGQLEQAETHLQQAVELERRTGDGTGPHHHQVLHEWSYLLRQQGRFAAAEQVIDELLAAATAPEDRDQRVSLLLSKADMRRLQGDPDDEERLAREALRELDAAVAGGDKRDVRENRAAAFDLLGAATSSRGDYVAALRHYLTSRELRLATHGKDHLLVAVSQTNVADTYRNLGEIELAAEPATEALRIQQQVFGENHPEVARTLSLLGDLELRRRRLDAAAELYERAQAIRVATLPEQHLDLATGHADRARIALSRDDHQRAADELRAALAIYEHNDATHRHAYAAALQNLGVALFGLRQPQEAESFYRRAYELHLELGGETKPPVADCLQNLALMRAAQGDPRGAIALHEQALALRTKYRPDRLRDLLASHSGIGAAARAAGDPRRAADADAACAELLDRMPDEHPQRVQAARIRAGREYLDAGDAAAATPLIEAVHEFCSEHLAGEWPLGEAASLLAECRFASGDTAAALSLAETGVALLERCPAPDKLERARATLQRVRAATQTADKDR
ncbi:MAG: serine/threonine protein kinase [Planctomycetes bacterium]|nr:serine/threonine protein kinase [Planctomycetota bacterium]